MIRFEVRVVGRWAHAQRSVYANPVCAISLNLTGLRHYRVRGVSLRNPGPMLVLNPVGTVCDFEFGPDRENWVLLGDTPDIRLGREPGTAELAWGGERIAVPVVVPVAPELAPIWHQEFLRLSDAFRDPVPANQLRLRLGLSALLRPFLDHGRPAVVSPAQRLKRLIEDDVHCREGIDALSGRCGGHPDVLRRSFVAAYGVTPMAYRGRCRLAAAMALIAGSGLGVGEIGRRIGFARVSHFSAFFRQAARMSPRQAIARYRNA
jgi:AraC-like DNA-binding protein